MASPLLPPPSAPPQDEASNPSGAGPWVNAPALPSDRPSAPPFASRARGHTVGARPGRVRRGRGGRHAAVGAALPAGVGAEPRPDPRAAPAPQAPARPAPSPFRAAAPEGRSPGFGFLQTPRPQGNRGVSGNRAGSAEVRSAGGVQRCGPVTLWKSRRELGKTGPGKAPPGAPAPSPRPAGVLRKGPWGRRGGCAGRQSLRNGAAPQTPEAPVLPPTVHPRVLSS